jgi:hypothetical protein
MLTWHLFFFLFLFYNKNIKEKLSCNFCLLLKTGCYVSIEELQKDTRMSCRLVAFLFEN